MVYTYVPPFGLVINSTSREKPVGKIYLKNSTSTRLLCTMSKISDIYTTEFKAKISSEVLTLIRSITSFVDQAKQYGNLAELCTIMGQRYKKFAIAITESTLFLCCRRMNRFLNKMKYC